MADSPLYHLRPHGRAVQSATLEGAFRVHIPPKELRELSLETGQLCQLKTQANKLGLAFAWPFSDSQTNSNRRVVKITDTVKDVFGLTYQDRVTITKSPEELRHADRVLIADVTQDTPPLTADEREEIEFWATHALVRLEALISGGSFEVTPRRGQVRGPRRRFLIEKIEPSSGADTSTTPFYFDFKSKCQVQEVVGLPSTPTGTFTRRFEMPNAGIGGLDKQVTQINKRIGALSDDARNNRIPIQLRRSGGILLYGAEGTGKSFLLSKIADAPWARVFHVDDTIIGPYTGQAQSALRKVFADAVTYQPSVIIIDKLESFVGKIDRDRDQTSNSTLATTLANEMDKLKGRKVLVVGATIRPNDIDKSLRTPARFRYEIELPIPNADARVEILKVLQHKDRLAPDEVSEAIGERTHGFVGQDLEALYETALEKATDRYCATDDYIHVHASVDNLSTLDGRTETGEQNGYESSDDGVQGFEVRLADFEAALLEIRPTAMREVFLETPKVKWSDIGGSGHVKRALYKVTERPFKRPDLIHDLDITPQLGILLYGPPGCSKTLTAKAVASEAGLNFIAVKGAELTSMYVGESERAIREVFRKARSAAPSIIFFDEIDAIASARGSSSNSSGLNVLTTILNEMDGIESLRGVLVLAATNKPDALDPALMRPGRFDTMLYIGPPSKAARLDILRIRTSKMPLAEDIDFDTLAERTEGYSGAEIVRICVEAAEATADERETSEESVEVSLRHFEAALKKVPRLISPEMVKAYEEFSVGGSMKL